MNSKILLFSILGMLVLIFGCIQQTEENYKLQYDYFEIGEFSWNYMWFATLTEDYEYYFEGTLVVANPIYDKIVCKINEYSDSYDSNYYFWENPPETFVEGDNEISLYGYAINPSLVNEVEVCCSLYLDEEMNNQICKIADIESPRIDFELEPNKLNLECSSSDYSPQYIPIKITNKGNMGSVTLRILIEYLDYTIGNGPNFYNSNQISFVYGEPEQTAFFYLDCEGEDVGVYVAEISLLSLNKQYEYGSITDDFHIEDSLYYEKILVTINVAE